MEFRLLEYFMEVCHELHFTRASENLGISQPTLSHQIQLLEARLNTKLFKRVGKKVYITQSGKILLTHARNIFYELEQAQTGIRELQGLLRGKLSIGSAGNHILSASAMAFHKQYPEIELSIMDFRTEETIEGLFTNQLDLGVIFLSEEHEQLEYIHLFDEEFFLGLSVNHDLANMDSISFSKLNSIPLALLPKEFLIRQFIDSYSEKVGIKLSPKLELSSLESLRHILNVNTVGTILPKSYITNIDDPKLRRIPIVDPIPREPVSIVYRKDAFQDTTVKTFIQHLVDYYKNLNFHSSI